jgi:hypothetical protein
MDGVYNMHNFLQESEGSKYYNTEEGCKRVGFCCIISNTYFHDGFGVDRIMIGYGFESRNMRPRIRSGNGADSGRKQN